LSLLDFFRISSLADVKYISGFPCYWKPPEVDRMCLVIVGMTMSVWR